MTFSSVFANRNPRAGKGRRLCGGMRGLPRQSQRRSNPRAGVSLIEVVISVAIFLASLTAILSLLNMGSETRLSVQLDAEAALRAESLMGEYLSGIRDMVGAADQPFDDEFADGWTFTTNIEQGDGVSLLKVTILVNHSANDGVNSSFRLVRLCRDPQLFLDAQMAAAEAEE